MKYGTLIFDKSIDRYDIRFGCTDYHGGLHCGECFDVMIGDTWTPTRIEMNMEQQWCLEGVHVEDLNGLRVRI